MMLVPNYKTPHGRLVVLAPPEVRIPGSFTRVENSSRQHEHLLRSLQRLRARLYTQDGAIRASEVSRDGRHRHPADERGWHLLALDANGEVGGCSRYVSYPNTVAFAQLGVRKAALAHSPEWGPALRRAIDSEITHARERGLAYVEVGGWALDPALRGSVEAVRIALATYSLARLLGGCIGITTATRRHCSSAILRKIGGRRVQIGAAEIPAYHDPQYACEMELLRFDSSEPNPRFEGWIEDLRSYLTTTLIIQSEPPAQAPERWVSQTWRLGQDLVHAVQ
ncbi:MAG TPA: hypothetical protein VGG72_02075 [Bryobacteraceae bacterium]|jgi:hypothetical protein